MNGQELFGGYTARPITGERFPRRRKAGLTGDDYADILKSKAFLKMDPLQQMEIHKIIQETKGLKAEEFRKSETHREEIETQKRAGELEDNIRTILASDRTPAQKAIALWVNLGIPKKQANAMVWGERPEGEVETRVPTRRERRFGFVAGQTYVPGTYQAPERKRPPGTLIGPTTEEQRRRLLPLEERQFDEAQRQFDITFQEAKRKAKTQEELQEATLEFNEKTAANLHARETQRIENQYELETKTLALDEANSARTFRLNEAAEERATTEMYHRMGIEDKTLVQGAYEFEKGYSFKMKQLEQLAHQFDITTTTGQNQFLAQLDQRADEFNATMTEEGKQFNLTFGEDVRRFDITTEEGRNQFLATLEEQKAKRADVMTQFGGNLELAYKQLDLNIKEFGLDEERQVQVQQLALWTFELEKEQFGERQAVQRWKERQAEKELWWKEKAFKLEDKKTQALIDEVYARIETNAKTMGFEQAIAKEKMLQGWETIKIAWAELNKQAGFKVDIPTAMSADLAAVPELQDDVISWVRATIDPKTGKPFTPTTKQWEEVNLWLYGIGEEEKRPMERLGINLSAVDWFRELNLQATWKPELRGFLLACRYNDACWKRLKDVGSAMDVYTEEPEAQGLPAGAGEWSWGAAGRQVLSTITGGLSEIPFPKWGAKTTTESSGNIQQDATEIGNRIGRGSSREKMKQELLKLNWTVEDMERELGGRW